jgi:hypothetical protein
MGTVTWSGAEVTESAMCRIAKFCTKLVSSPSQAVTVRLSITATTIKYLVMHIFIFALKALTTATYVPCLAQNDMPLQSTSPSLIHSRKNA